MFFFSRVYFFLELPERKCIFLSSECTFIDFSEKKYTSQMSLSADHGTKLPKPGFFMQHIKVLLQYNVPFAISDMKEWHAEFGEKLPVEIIEIDACVVKNTMITSILLELDGKFRKKNAEAYFKYLNKYPEITKIDKAKWEARANLHTKNPNFHYHSMPKDRQKKAKILKSPTRPLPPAVDNYRSTEIIRSNTVYTTAQSKKELFNYLKTTVGPIHDELGLQYCLLTLCFSPANIPIRPAWNTIPHLETQIANLLQSQYPEIQYIISTIEVHPALKGNKKKAKTQKEVAKAKKKRIVVVGEEEEKDDSEDDTDGDDDTTQYPDHEEHNRFIQRPHHEDDLDYRHQAIISVFRLYDYDLTPSVEQKDENTIVGRAVQFMDDNSISHSRNPTTCDELKRYTNRIYTEIVKLGVPEKKVEEIKAFLENPKRREGKDNEDFYPTLMATAQPATRLKGYPHIHMAIARTKLSNQLFRDLRVYMKAITDNTVFRDVLIEDKALDQCHHSISQRKGKILEASQEHPVGYVLKNSQHAVVMNYLPPTRFPCTLYNSHKLPKVNKLFDNISKSYSISINGVIPTTGVLEVKEDELSHLTKKQREENNILDRIAAYMITNKYAFVYGAHGSVAIWQRKPDTISCWVPTELDRKDLWAEMLSVRANIDMRPHKQTYEQLSESKAQKIFPKIEINHYLTEFDGFIYDRRSNTTTTIYTDPCYSHYPDIKLEDIPIVLPEHFLIALDNSNYVDLKGKPLNDEGDKLLLLLFDVILKRLHKSKCPILWGESSSGRSSLIIGLASLYPSDKVKWMKNITSFSTGYSQGKKMVIFDEFKKLLFEDISELLEGNRDQDLNTKNRDVITGKLDASVILIANKLDPFAPRETVENSSPPSYGRESLEKVPTSGEKEKPKDKKSTKLANPAIKERKTRTDELLAYYQIDEGYKTRGQFHHFIKLKNPIVGGDALLEKEAGKILLFLARHYYKKSPQHVTNSVELKKLTSEGITKMENRQTPYLEQFKIKLPIKLTTLEQQLAQVDQS